MTRIRGLHKSICIAAVCLSSSPIFSVNLLEVYNQAAKSDPIFAQALSTWQSQKMKLPIAEAGYFPTLATTADANNTTTQYYPAISTQINGALVGYGYSLTLTQPILDFAAWTQIRGAKNTVKAATATYLAAQQSLMQRTATAYFDVLQAYDRLHYTIANKRAVWQQYVTAREQFKVGLVAITDKYDARSRYDQVVAQQISAQNGLNDALENLRAITGQYYRSLTGLGKRIPFIMPTPNNIDQWVDVANKQNYSLIAQAYAVQAAMDNIKQQASAGYPLLNAQGNYTENRQTGNHLNSGLPNNSGVETTVVGLNLTYNPFQGGLVTASIKQARYDYVTASGLLEQTHRDVVNKTRSNFLGVLSGISQIKADKQRIISSKNAFAATEAGFKVGTRTMVDVLNDLTTLYQAQQQYANDQYAYIDSLIALKAAAGTLSVNDLQAINLWLNQSIVFPAQLSVAHVPADDIGMNHHPLNNIREESVKDIIQHHIQPDIRLLPTRSQPQKTPVKTPVTLPAPTNSQ